MDLRIRDVLNRKIFRFFHRKQITGKGSIVFDYEDCMLISKKAHINLYGDLFLNTNRIKRNGRSSILRLDDFSTIDSYGFSFMYDADVILFKGARLTLGKGSFINSNCKVRCHCSITIGADCAISHDFTIMDSDAHELNGDRNIKPINIGNNVWIGTRVTVLSGVNIGDGAVVAAGSLVNSDVPPGALVAGVPARIIKNKVEWKP